MATLVCDLCGGKLVMGAGGKATCENCGMEYNSDWIKERVQGANVGTQATSAQQIENWYELGQQAQKSSNPAEAYRYFSMVVEADGTHWRALIDRAWAAVSSTEGTENRVPEMETAVKRAFAIIESTNLSYDEEKEATYYIFSRGQTAYFYSKMNLTLAFHGASIDSFLSSGTLGNFSVYREKQELNKNYLVFLEKYLPYLEKFAEDAEIAEHILNYKKSTLEAIKELCEAEEGAYGINGLTLAEKKKYLDMYIPLYREVKAKDSSFNADYSYSPDPFEKPRNSFELSKREQTVKTHWRSFDMDEQRRIAQERITRYWEEHKEQKAQYEDRLEAIAEELADLNRQAKKCDTEIASIQRELSVRLPIENQLAEVRRSQEDLMAQKSRLGIFAGKQKKLLQEQIDALTPQIETLELEVIQQKNAIKNSVAQKVSAVEAEKRPLVSRIQQLEKERNTINAELTKAR